MQNAGLAALGLDWQYLAFEVAPEDLPAAIKGAQALRFIGLNLTVPHKVQALALVDELAPCARQWSAVNTIRFEARGADGAWQPLSRFVEPPAPPIRAVGFNTDADAMVLALRRDLGVTVAGARVLLLGTGGAGRTAALKLAGEGVAELFLVNRTIARAQSLAREVAGAFPEIAVRVGYPPDRIDLLLNATSLGLQRGDPLPFDAARFELRRAASVFDMVYRPAETRLLNEARAAGCRGANGLGMLLYQGAAALELWSGQPAPLAVMRRALEREVGRA
jgi:shikimate dehydrogenase